LKDIDDEEPAERGHFGFILAGNGFARVGSAGCHRNVFLLYKSAFWRDRVAASASDLS
jgi:hypothetical protein